MDHLTDLQTGLYENETAVTTLIYKCTQLQPVSPPVRNMKNTHQMLVFTMLLSEITNYLTI